MSIKIELMHLEFSRKFVCWCYDKCQQVTRCPLLHDIIGPTEMFLSNFITYDL